VPRLLDTLRLSLKEGHVLLEALPTDSTIPALGAIREDGLCSLLDRVGLSARGAEAQLLKHHPTKRCTFRIDLDGGPVALKLYASDPSPLANLLRRFELFGLATGRDATVHPLLGFDGALRFIVTGWLHGPSGSDLISNGAGERAAELALDWLEAAARVSIELGERYGPAEILVVTGQRVRRIAGVEAALGSLASVQYERLVSDPPGDAPMNVRHASFKPNSMIDIGGPGLIDWDGFRQGALEFETAGFLSALSRMAQGSRASVENVDQIGNARRTFREGITSQVDERALGWYLVADLVKIAERLVRHQPHDWQKRAHALLLEAATVLEQRL
jgi:hypothetical protein